MATMTRTDAEALFQESYQADVIKEATRRSVALQSIRTLPMGTNKHRMPILDALPTATWLTAPQEVKAKTTMKWDSLYLYAEEIAVIVPIGEDVLADATIDVWSQVRDALGQAFGVAIDAAVFFGVNAPATFPTGGIHQVAVTANQDVEYDATDPLQSWSDLFSLVEDQGGDVDRLWAGRRIRGLLRTTRDSNGLPIPEVNAAGIFGEAPRLPLYWDRTKSLALVGDSSYAMLGIRQDLTFKFSDQATLTDFGNLFEKDSIALRAVMRLGFTLANPLRLETGAREYPFATMTPAEVAS